MTTLVLVLKKIESEVKQNMMHFIHTLKQKQLSMKVTLIMYLNQSKLQLYQTCKKSFGKWSGWITFSAIEHNISISKYNPLAGSSYIKLTNKLGHLRKCLFNIQNIGDNEWFQWRLVRYLNPADHHPARIKKADKSFVKKLYFKGITFPVKIRDIHSIEKKSSIDNSVFEENK